VRRSSHGREGKVEYVTSRCMPSLACGTLGGNPVGDWSQRSQSSPWRSRHDEHLPRSHARHPECRPSTMSGSTVARPKGHPPTCSVLPPGPTLQIHMANPKVGNVRDQGIDLLDPVAYTRAFTPSINVSNRASTPVFPSALRVDVKPRTPDSN
jgi:hypothetical protein